MFTDSTLAQLRVASLVILYVLRMAFFQTLIASPNIAQVSTFKVTIAQHQAKDITHLPITHRSHVQKHILFKAKLPQIIHIDAFQTSFAILQASYTCIFKFQDTDLATLIANFNLKLYRLYRTFLI